MVMHRISHKACILTENLPKHFMEIADIFSNIIGDSICEVKTENLEGRNVFHCMSEYQSEHIIVNLNRLSWFVCRIRLFPTRECRDLTLQRSAFISRHILNLQ